jgi:hypothetical protein
MPIRSWAKKASGGLAGALLCGMSLLVAGGVAATPPAGAVTPANVTQAIPTALAFPDTPLGTYTTLGGPLPDGTPADGLYFLNRGQTQQTDDIDLTSDVTFSGPGADDYVISPGSCGSASATVLVIVPGDFCYPDISFFPGALGDRAATLTIQGSEDPTPISVSLDGTGTTGYYQVDSHGNVGVSGDATSFGGAGSLSLSKPIVAITPTGDDGGYWLVASDGGIFSYGDAQFFGSTGGMHLNKPIVGMATTLDAGGYWLVASDGGIFSYGDAPFYGSTGGTALNKPIVGMASTPDGGGYWLVASDGGIFSYGDAQFYGSTGGIHLNQPIVSMAPSPDGLGYWFSAADGGLFNYGDAPFLGSGVGTGLGQVVDMAGISGATVQSITGLPAIRQAHLSTIGTAIARQGARHLASPKPVSGLS